MLPGATRVAAGVGRNPSDSLLFLARPGIAVALSKFRFCLRTGGIGNCALRGKLSNALVNPAFTEALLDIGRNRGAFFRALGFP